MTTPLDTMRESLRLAAGSFDSLGCIASCAPHDDEAKAGEEFSRIMRKAYDARDSARAAIEQAENARTIAIDPAIFSAVRRALDYSVSRMHLDENEKTGLRALSDDILSIELSGRQNVPAAPILEDSQGVSRAESAEQGDAARLATALRRLLNYAGGWDEKPNHPCGFARDTLAEYDAKVRP